MNRTRQPGGDVAGKADHRGWGHLRKLPSGRWQASYLGPDIARHTAPSTFDTKDAATVWLANERALTASDEWTPPKLRAARRRPDTFETYARAWLTTRPLKPRTVAHYTKLVDSAILPTFGAMAIRHITPESVRIWFAGLDAGKAKPTPTQNAHAYALLKAICATATDDDLLPSNPCRVRGAGQAKRASRTTIATPQQLRDLVAAMPERYQAMTALAAWTGMRWGELTELRRKDLNLKAGLVHVRRGVSLVNGEFIVGTPKSHAGIRDVHVPENVLPLLRRHLERMGVSGRDALLFPSAGDPTKHLRTATYARVFSAAKVNAGLPESFRVHDLRHTAGSNATAVGASLVDVMGLLGHSTTAAAMRYQHSTKDRAAQLAEAMAKLANDA